MAISKSEISSGLPDLNGGEKKGIRWRERKREEGKKGKEEKEAAGGERRGERREGGEK